MKRGKRQVDIPQKKTPGASLKKKKKKKKYKTSYCVIRRALP
jgi:hypothetical protein